MCFYVTTVLITWQTAMEEQNDYFIIEKSSNGREYKEIDRVKGHGTTTCITNYKTIDPSPRRESTTTGI